jgi:hypothetical protein
MPSRSGTKVRGNDTDHERYLEVWRVASASQGGHLLDKDATAKGIEAAIDGLQGEVKPSDVFVLYVAGHGRSIAGTYYFLPQDLQFEGGQTVMSGGISQDMFQKWLAKIPAQKSILILDTCESATARGDIEQETAIDRLQHATGRSVITAASSSAFEGYQGHGLLTYTILENLTTPDESGNDEVTLSKLAAYVYDQVPKISQRVFGERQQPHNTIADDFPLGERVAAVAKPETEPTIPKTPTHVLIRSERVHEQASSDAPGERILAVGTLVRVVQPLQGWALIAREGEKLGYVPEDALAPVQGRNFLSEVQRAVVMGRRQIMARFRSGLPVAMAVIAALLMTMVGSPYAQRAGEEGTGGAAGHAATVPETIKLGGRRIVGGEKTDIKDHPWQVALNIKTPEGTYLCGGSIIAQRWVLTAAHCISRAQTGDVKAKAVRRTTSQMGPGPKSAGRCTKYNPRHTKRCCLLKIKRRRTRSSFADNAGRSTAR